MNLADVMDEVAARVDTIDGLRVSAFPPDQVQPPAAVVTYPEEYLFDETYGRGMDRLTLPVIVMVGRVSDRKSRDQLAAYCDGSGARSLKAVLEYVPGASVLTLPNTEGAIASTPHTVDLDVTAGIVVEWDVTTPATPPADLDSPLTMWPGAEGGLTSWITWHTPDAAFTAGWHDSVADEDRFPVASHGSLVLGARRTYKVEINAGTGITTFSRATQWDGAYEVITVDGDPAGALRVALPTTPLRVGGTGSGFAGGFSFSGGIHHARVSKLDGTVLAYADFTDHVDGTTSFVQDGRTWTVAGAASIDGDPIVPYTAFDTVRVQGAVFDIVSMAGVEYVAATLTLDIAGPGS